MEHGRVPIAYFVKDQGVRQAQGNGSALEILEVRSITKSDARTRKVRRQRQHSARGAP